MAPSRSDFTKSFVRKPGTRGDANIPISSEAPPPLRQPTKIARSKTLTRPDRAVAQPPLINPQGADFSTASTSRGEKWSPWRVTSRIVTFWAPGTLLSSMGGLKDASSQQAWREKVTLCFIALLLGGFIGFVTMGLNAALCPSDDANSSSRFVRIGQGGATLGIEGWEFDISSAQLPGQDEVGYNLYTRSSDASGYDITPLFSRVTATDYPSCEGLTGSYATISTCQTNSSSTQSSGLKPCPLGNLNATNLNDLGVRNTSRLVGYGWEDLANANYSNYLVVDGNVLNMEPYMIANPQLIPNDPVDAIIRTQLRSMSAAGGKDATRFFYSHSEAKKAVPCIKQKYFAGNIDKITPGCFVSNLFLYASLIIILGIVFIRFFMAIWFSWFMSWRMTSPPKENGRRRIAHNIMPEGAITNVNSSGAAPWANKERPPPSAPARIRHFPAAGKTESTYSSSASIPDSLSPEVIGTEPYTICLVTAYSEGEEGISNTLTSLSETTYSDSRKLLFVVADGMVTGSGEAQSTPDICVGLLDADPRFGTPMPMSFMSVAQGKKQHNMAMVYAGHYTRARGHRTPMIVVVKCGTPEEATEKKPGNRGKRDSQMILMNFFQRVTYNDRMTPLDYDLFRKVHALMGVTPDFFELCLMVDADTKVYPSSITVLANCMMHDNMIMGACGETRISNKRASWVTAIQVFEYFISHHLAKAFESVFGGVTCLPGCFSMYRIKARKLDDDDWVPVIVKPEVTREYSQNTVTTLHQKNLLLLGEDRFLTTLLLRTFPNRKMVFCPQARCRTEVPHTFKMLLSQRRRWINSTVHNLMELVLVRDLCGTFCFSMQFVVFMDLIGTAVLPVAIALTYTLAVTYILNPPHTFTEAIPLMLLIAVIGLPAVLILLATRKVVYVLWMLVYLVALPVWNFILPVYSFWHFDDFSWGETRKVEGEGKDQGHGEGDGVFSAASVPLRRWEDWERSRLRKLKREEKRRREFEKQYGRGFYNDDSGDTSADQSDNDRLRPRPESDSWSNTESETEDDRWGMQIGGYDESRPPPLAIVRHSLWVDGQEVYLDQQDMEMMLEKGWDDGSGSPNLGMPRPSVASARRSRFELTDTPVPKIPDRFSHLPPASPGEYHHLMRSGPPSPAMGGEGQGHSSAVGSAANTHARNRSQGSQNLNVSRGPPRAPRF